MIWAAVILYSAVLGSLLNVIIYRLPFMLLEERTQKFNLFFPGSHCPQCETPIKIIDKTPVLGFFFAKGRCRFCQKPISWQYPLIEIGFIALVSLLFWKYGLSAKFIFLSIFSFLGLALSCIDWQYMILPDGLVGLLLASGLAANSQDVFTTSELSILSALLGFFFFWLIYFIYQNRKGQDGLGLGDVKLIAAIGAWVAPFTLMSVILLASVLLLFVGIGRAILGKQKLLKQRLPFGPFLLISGMAGVMCNYMIQMR